MKQQLNLGSAVLFYGSHRSSTVSRVLSGNIDKAGTRFISFYVHPNSVLCLTFFVLSAFDFLSVIESDYATVLVISRGMDLLLLRI